MFMRRSPSFPPPDCSGCTFSAFRMNSVCVITALGLLLASLGSSYPLHDGVDMDGLMPGNALDRFKVHFSWRNLSCPVCKAVFTVVDIALLVRKAVFCFSESLWVFTTQQTHRHPVLLLNMATLKWLSDTGILTDEKRGGCLCGNICWLGFTD